MVAWEGFIYILFCMPYMVCLRQQYVPSYLLIGFSTFSPLCLYCIVPAINLSVLEDRFSIFAQHAICHFVLCVLTLWTFTSILVPILNAQRSYSSSNLNLSRMLIGNVV